MLATHLWLRNWRNFRQVDVALRENTYLLGPNASGKSNLLDVFRFLRDVSKAQGGGLQKAVSDRGGISKLRCLHARRSPEVSIKVELADTADEQIAEWTYELEFKHEGKGAQRTLISREQVHRRHELILDRPNSDDKRDTARLTQTHLEQIQANAEFRDISDFFHDTTYLHLVPQMLKYGTRIGGQRLEGDPFGQGFLEAVAKASPRSRVSRLNRIQRALELAVPQFKQLRFLQDTVTGQPHLEALYAHHRPNAGWQREDSFPMGPSGFWACCGLCWRAVRCCCWRSQNFH